MKVWRILVVGHSIFSILLSSDVEEDAYRRACLVGGLLVVLIVEEKVAVLSSDDDDMIELNVEVAECRWWRFVEENARQLDLLVLVKAAHESIMDENAMMDRISVGLLRMLCIAIKLEVIANYTTLGGGDRREENLKKWWASRGDWFPEINSTWNIFPENCDPQWIFLC